MYYKKLPEYPTFEIMINNADGNIPSTYVKDWKEFQAILNDDFFNSNDKELIYRGQEVYNWALVPSLGRLDEAGMINNEIANKHLNDFKLSIRGRIKDNNLFEDIELWALGQHNGLQTPLLDWTYSPYIALFFAFEKNENLEQDKESRAIFVLNKKALEDLGADFFEQPTRNEHSRLINQAGLFTNSIFDTNDTVESYILNLISKEADVDLSNPDEVAYYICKIHIPNINQNQCLQHLKMMNIHHGSLFPDVIGSSLYCNELIKEHIKFLDNKKQVEKIALAFELDTDKFIKYASVDSEFIFEYINLNQDASQIKDKKSFSERLSKKLLPIFSIDWWTKDSVIAKLKNVIRIELRKEDIFPEQGSKIAEDFINILISKEKQGV